MPIQANVTAMFPSTSEAPILLAPAPWRLKGTVYTFLTYTTSSNLESVQSFMYSPLEARSRFADGKFLGGVGMVQVIRYTDTPVGPYDELLIVPGTFGYHTGGVEGSGEAIKEEKHMRVTRIYVSQKQTCWNGRNNWNIPKHIARFSFKDLPGNRLSIEVYPHIDDGSGSILRSSPTPFFTATYKPISYLPSFPISTTLAKYIGMDLHLAQPPLPQGHLHAEELRGTDKWRRVMPYECCKKTSLGWWDLKQGDATEDDSLLSTGDDRDVREGYENFWPGIGRWRIGAKMEDALIEFPEGIEWEEVET